MGKVSIGLRGWRFDESTVFADDGEFRPLGEIPPEDRERLLRLTRLVEEPCDACYLDRGPAAVERCRPAEIVYGEPRGEVLLCASHEADFLYWFREAGGDRFRGEREMADEFHAWYADGGRAPDGYGGLDHVEANPESLPEPPDPEAVQERLETDVEFEGERIDLRQYDEELFGERDGEPLSEDALAAADVDLAADYPSAAGNADRGSGTDRDPDPEPDREQ